MRASHVGAIAFWLVTAGGFSAAVMNAVFFVPEDADQGVIQKIFYLHLPVAINALLACLVVFVGSIGYLLQRKLWWDDLATAGARTAVLFCSVVLVTGMIWARVAWNTWWTWSPKLTFSLLLWLLYVVYLVLRASIDSEQRRSVVAAAYGIVAFLDVPLVYLSSKLIPEMHPASISLALPMKLGLILFLVPVTLLAGGLVVMGWRVQSQERAIRGLASARKSIEPMKLDLIREVV